jgi:Peptidase A4 family
MKLRIVFTAIALATLSAVAPAVSASAAVRATHPRAGADDHYPAQLSSPAGRTLTSTVWAGWLDVAHKNVQIYSVTSTFRVPRTTCPVKHAIAYLWVGLDGATDNTVEQDGVAAYCGRSGGHSAEYYDWYEMFPKDPVPKHFVHTGDTIVATVSYDPRNHKYRLKVVDKTHHGADFSVTKLCNRGTTCHRSTAEVIAEDPGGGAANGHFLANFHRVGFNHVRVTSRNGTVGHLRTNKVWTAFEIIMKYKGIVMAKPSNRHSGDTAFSVVFKDRG